MSNLNIDGSSASNNDTNGVSSAYHSDKIEAIGLEYSYLLTSQLESQRSFYESQLKELKTKYNSLQDERDREKISFKDLELKNSPSYSLWNSSASLESLNLIRTRHRLG